MTDRYTLHHGNNLDILPTIPDATVDAIITDPPYELGFMGKKWDASGIAYSVDLWAECLRVLKPGGHLLAFGGTRTYHRMAVAIEDAGFEIRDSIHWIYGSGFPKSLDVSKAIDKAAGAEREVVGSRTLSGTAASTNPATGTLDGSTGIGAKKDVDITAPATDEAKQWEGWGTALKPAHEPIVLARKPLTGTVAANVLQHGTGALNINACRIGDSGGTKGSNYAKTGLFGIGGKGDITSIDGGRWPANVMFDTDAADELGPEARFFYVAKPSRTERNAGLDQLPERAVHRFGAGIGEGKNPNAPAIDTNFHPTVKPITLMRYLIRLVTPPNGTILDPFAGSGTTLAAAILEGHHPIGIELTDDYHPIIHARCQHATLQHHTNPPTLF